MAVRALERDAALARWTVLDDDTDRIKAVVSAEGGGYAVRAEDGRELGRYPSIRAALEALPTICG